MPETDITTKLQLVRAAIDRAKTAKARHLVAEQDPSSAGAERMMARGAYESCRHEFGFQWENVEALLARFVPGYRPTLGEHTAVTTAPVDKIEIERNSPNQFTVCTGERYENQLTFDEALGAVASWIIKPEARPAFLRTHEEHEAFELSLERQFGEQLDGTLVVPALEGKN